MGAGEMALQSRVLAVLAEDWSSVPNIPLNYLQLQFLRSLTLSLTSVGSSMHRHINTDIGIHMHK